MGGAWTRQSLPRTSRIRNMPSSRRSAPRLSKPVLRRTEVDKNALFRSKASTASIAAGIPLPSSLWWSSVLANLPGFLKASGFVPEVPTVLSTISTYACFVGLAVAALVCLVLCGCERRAKSQDSGSGSRRQFAQRNLFSQVGAERIEAQRVRLVDAGMILDSASLGFAARSANLPRRGPTVLQALHCLVFIDAFAYRTRFAFNAGLESRQVERA